MGRQDVYEFLKKHPDSWFTVREIAEKMGFTRMRVNRALNSLRKTGEVYWEETFNPNNNLPVKLYKYREESLY